MNKKLALGIDIGGTNCVFGLVEADGTIVFETSLVTKDFETLEALIDQIYSILTYKNYISTIAGIGVGAPNGNFHTGTIEYAPNLHWKGVLPIALLFSEKFGIKTTITNDANAAAIGEMKYGAGRDLKDFITITLGTGLGSGIIINKQLVYGHDGFAGELGHFRVIPDGRLCGCGRKGCLETYASSTGVVRSFSELESINRKDSSLNNISNLEAIDIFQAADKGDHFALEIIDFTAKTLGESLADFTCFSSPEAYILFGGIAHSGEAFAQLVKKYMEQAMLIIYKDKVEIRISSLHHSNAAVLGASSLVW